MFESYYRTGIFKVQRGSLSYFIIEYFIQKMYCLEQNLFLFLEIDNNEISIFPKKCCMKINFYFIILYLYSKLNYLKRK